MILAEAMLATPPAIAASTKPTPLGLAALVARDGGGRGHRAGLDDDRRPMTGAEDLLHDGDGRLGLGQGEDDTVGLGGDVGGTLRQGDTDFLGGLAALRAQVETDHGLTLVQQRLADRRPGIAEANKADRIGHSLVPFRCP